jgi:uncharacterized protein with HEPN domain
MLDAAGRVARYLEGLSKEQFVARDMAFDAVCLNLVRIGEGANFLTDDVKTKLPSIHWPDLVTMRNRIAHGYKSLEEEIIWRTAVDSVPALARAIRTLVEAFD